MLPALITSFTLSFAIQPTARPALPAAAVVGNTRCAAPLLQDLQDKKLAEVAAGQKDADAPIVWTESESGFKWIDTTVGAGAVPEAKDVVQVHYTVTLLSSGTTLGTSRNGAPLTLALGKHEVPIWDEGLRGMRVGGQRRLLVPPGAIPDSQATRVPGENRVLRFDIELLEVLDKSSPSARVASTFGPYDARKIGPTLYLAVWLASFIPYFLPVDMQPGWYHDGKTPEEIQERRLNRQNDAYIGGDLSAFNDLFPN